MTKQELTVYLQKRFPELQKKDVAAVVQLVFDSMAEALVRGDRIEIRNFGVFSVRKNNSRRARNPKTGDTVVVPPRRVPVFKAGKEIKKLVDA